MKQTLLITSAIVAMTAAAQAVTLITATVSPVANNATDLGGSIVGGGSITGTASPALAVNAVSTIASATYSTTLSGLTIDGVSGVSITLDFTLTAGATSGTTQGMVVNGPTWTVDSDATGNAGTNRTSATETTTVAVSSVSITAPSGYTGTADFVAFTGHTETWNTGSFDLGTGVFTGGNGNIGGERLSSVSFSLNTSVTPIPEPSSTALLGLGGLALILRRRK